MVPITYLPSPSAAYNVYITLLILKGILNTLGGNKSIIGLKLRTLIYFILTWKKFDFRLLGIENFGQTAFYIYEVYPLRIALSTDHNSGKSIGTYRLT